MKKRVALVLKDDSSRQLIKLFIDGGQFFKVVAEMSNYFDIETFVLKAKPDILIMDLQFSEDQNGIEAILEVKRALHYCTILVISEIRKPNVVISSFKAGASSYILNSENVHHEILDFLKDLSNGGAPLSSEISRLVVRSFRSNMNPHLSRRESQVLKLMAQAKTYTEIAEDLAISSQTAKTHIKNIYRKLKVKTKKDAIESGIENEVVYNRNIMAVTPG